MSLPEALSEGGSEFANALLTLPVLRQLLTLRGAVCSAWATTRALNLNPIKFYLRAIIPCIILICVIIGHNVWKYIIKN